MTSVVYQPYQHFEVPDDVFYGEVTARNLHNFPIGKEKMCREIIYAILQIKLACAKVNHTYGAINSEQITKIEEVVREFLDISNDELIEKNFPLTVWQTGSGTATNMNANEVIANAANVSLDDVNKLHPNDHINRSQSTNDVFPSSIYIAVFGMSKTLVANLHDLEGVLDDISKRFPDVITVGRTHLQDATLIPFSMQIDAYKRAIQEHISFIETTQSNLLSLPLGGTAVGTGINAPSDFGEKVCEILSDALGCKFKSEENKPYLQSLLVPLVEYHSSLKSLATTLLKISNDIRFRASGPRAGIAELIIPANEAGSSIMPGKVNPTQAEMLIQVCLQTLGNDVIVSNGASLGNFELNNFLPIVSYNTIQSTRLLTDGIKSFNDKLLRGLKPNISQINKNVQNSIMVITKLNPLLGYEKATEISKYALEKDICAFDAALELTDFSREQLTEILFN